MSLLLVLPVLAWAQQQNVPAATVGPLSAAITYTVTSSQTISLPSGWHIIRYHMAGGGGGSGCGIVATSGTAASGGNSGGTGARSDGLITPAMVGGATGLTVTIGAAGASCAASGTTAGSTGTTATAAGATSFTLGGLTFSGAGGGMPGANGQNGAVAASASTGTSNGNSQIASQSCSTTIPVGCGGAVSNVTGTQPNYGWGQAGVEEATSGGAGAGFSATPANAYGGSGTGPFGGAQHQPANGNLSCLSGSQNGGSAAGLPGTLAGVGGGGGASCTAAVGGNGGASSGPGASGGAGGDALPGFPAGSGGASSPGGAIFDIS